MIQQPTDELLTLVRRNDGGEVSQADRQSASLVRRRFGLALPPPFAEPVRRLPDGTLDLPIRVADGVDGPAIAAVKWRSWRVGYRGVLDDDVLDALGIHPSVPYWTGRATVPPSRRHTLLVAGRPGEVHGFCDTGPSTDAGLDPASDGQVYAVYLDPTLYRQGVGTALIDAALERLGAVGVSAARLWVIESNRDARRFYEARGWAADGATIRWDFDGRPVDEVRYRYSPPASDPVGSSADPP